MATKSTCRRTIGLTMALCLAGCTTFASTGPSAGRVAAEAVKLETVTPETASALWDQVQSTEQSRQSEALADLSSNVIAADVRLLPGTRVNVTLWTQPLVTGSAANVGAVLRSDLGTFTVTNEGVIDLPYTGPVHVAGLSLQQAQADLSARIARMRKFQAPEVTLTVQENVRQQIIVTGAANRPTTIAWRDGGITLAEAITQAGGPVLQNLGQSPDRMLTANVVRIVRKGATYELPLRAALEADLPLQPNDQLVIEHKPVVRVQCLGGGWSQSTVQSFDEVPSLSRVVAAGGGLNPQTAQGAAVFVLSPDRTTIYQFRWNSLAGLQAAQRFPVQDGAIIYIASAPIIRIQQITQILFSAAYPINTAKGL